MSDDIKTTMKTTAGAAHAWAAAAEGAGMSRLQWMRLTLDSAAGTDAMPRPVRLAQSTRAHNGGPEFSVTLIAPQDAVQAWRAAAERAGVNSLNRWACTVLSVAAGASELYRQLGRVRPLG
jgi:hypothetical protein